MKLSDYHFAQAKACRELAKNYPEQTLHWSVYIVQSQNHGRLAAAFDNLEGQQEYIDLIEDAHRKKKYDNEMKLYAEMSLPNPEDNRAALRRSGASSCSTAGDV